MEISWARYLLWAAGILALGAGGGLLASTVVASHAYRQNGETSRRHTQTVTVTGSARQRIVSDWATWRISVEGEAADLQSAFEKLKAGTERVKTFLLSRKFTEQEITLGSIQTETHYKRDAKDHETREIASYTLSRTVGVACPRVNDVNEAASAVTELLQEGVHVVSSPPAYTYTRVGELKIAMLGEATKDARTRAETIAQHAGCRLSEVVGAHMGVLQITPPDSMDVSGEGRYDVSTIQKDVTAVVTLTLTLTLARD